MKNKAGVYILVTCVALFVLFKGLSYVRAVMTLEYKMNEVHSIRGVSNFRKTFNDLNSTQLESARKWGIEPVEDRESVKNKMDQLVLLENNDLYVIDDLTHSVPYLVPKAKELLDKIGMNFSDSLISKGINPNKLIVTSVLRTLKDVKQLRGKNKNASSNSAHTYGTTFDISYRRFFAITSDHKYKYEETSPDLLKQVLAEVLKDLKTEKACFVKYELKQMCFHITVR